MRFPKNDNIPVEFNYKGLGACVVVNHDKTIGIKVFTEEGPQYLDMTEDCCQKLVKALAEALACVK